ncbi:unnamed protein product [Brassicogethes aeneus]|uniref:Uncharacterized protein n=1 Tax=Brassicogethes aeneus TaxID=1431903 RepID=A0A9P0BF05_BRAAE|nr:unnamed protein product [Brassicogethes aeneus]
MNRNKPPSATFFTLAHKLKTKLSHIEGPAKAMNTAGPSQKPSKPTRKINITWKCDNKIVRMQEGGPLQPVAHFCLHHSTTLKSELSEKKQKRVRTRKKKTQLSYSSSSSEDGATNNRPSKKTHPNNKKQNSKYSLTTSSSSDEFAKNEDVNVQSSGSISLSPNDSFDIEEFLKLHAPDPKDMPATVDELPGGSTNYQELPISTEDYSEYEVIDLQTVNEQSQNLDSELTIIRQKIQVDKPLLVNACREDPVSSMRNAMKRCTFSPYQKIDVQFVDVDEVPEGAIDEGGPSRELFRLSLKQLQNSEIFIGSP